MLHCPYESVIMQIPKPVLNRNQLVGSYLFRK